MPERAWSQSIAHRVLATCQRQETPAVYVQTPDVQILAVMGPDTQISSIQIGLERREHVLVHPSRAMAKRTLLLTAAPARVRQHRA